MLASLVLMVSGHLILHGQAYDPVNGQTFNPLRLYVSDYAGKWPEGLWIKAAILCFCLALAWFCDLAMRELGTRNRVIAGRLFWLTLTGVMITGLLMVIRFDMLPASYMETHNGWFWKLIGYGPHYESLPRSDEELSGRRLHSRGFALFIGAYFIAALTMVMAEMRKDIRTAVAAATFVLAVGGIRWWQYNETSLPGVPQRVLIVVVASWLACTVLQLRKIGADAGVLTTNPT